MNQSNGKRKRMTKKFWSGYFASFLTLKQNALTKMVEFKKIEKINNPDIDFVLIRGVLMESVILDMAKILGVTGSDQTGIKKIMPMLLSKNFVEYENKLQKLSKIHKQTISKIKENRNRIISHLDFYKNPYYQMKLSDEEIERIFTYSPYMFNSKEEYELIKKQAKKLVVTKQKRNQQYRVVDFKKEIPIFESLIQELFKIFNEIAVQFNFRKT